MDIEEKVPAGKAIEYKALGKGACFRWTNCYWMKLGSEAVRLDNADVRMFSGHEEVQLPKSVKLVVEL